MASKSFVSRILIFAYLLFVPSLFAFAEEAPEAEYQAGEVLVQVQRETPPEEVERIAASVGARLNRPIVPGELYLLSFDEEIPVFEIIEQLTIHPAVQYAEPNYLAELFLLGGADPGQAGLAASGAPVVVAVIDTGLDMAHSAFTGRIYVNAGEIAGDGIDNDGNGYTDDVNGYDFHDRDGDPGSGPGFRPHGTWVAGRVLQGALDAQVQLMPLRLKLVVDSRGREGLTMDSIIEAINYAAANGAQIINMSFGTVFPSQSLQTAVQQAAAQGVLLVAAAGNDGWFWNDPNYPAAFSEVVSVAASDASGRKAWFSNYGPTVDFTAPGYFVETPTPGGGTARVSGTSFSAPFLAGVAARILAALPQLAPAEVVERLTSFALDVYARNSFFRGKLGVGLINETVSKAVSEALPLTPVEPPEPDGELLRSQLEQVGKEIARLEPEFALAQQAYDASLQQLSAVQNEASALQGPFLAQQRSYFQAVFAWMSSLFTAGRSAPATLQRREEMLVEWRKFLPLLSQWADVQGRLRRVQQAERQKKEQVELLKGQLDSARARQKDLNDRLSLIQAPAQSAPLTAQQLELRALLSQWRAVQQALEGGVLPEGVRASEAPNLFFPEASEALER